MRTIVYIALLSLLLFNPGCEQDFIEDDLTGKTVTILAPADDDTVSLSTPLFWWNEISGALTYRVQIVYPDFVTPQQLLFDTAVTGDRFIPSLDAGRTYYWRIRPENGSSEGDWVVRRITIDSSAGLSTQSVVITLPASNGYTTSNSLVSFAWNIISGATLYRVEIVNTTSGATITSTTTAVNSFSYQLSTGNFEFRVRAENLSSITAWSSRTFVVDQTAPSTPSLVSPADNTFYASTPGSISFDWTNYADAVSDSLWIGTDSTFATGVIVQLNINATQSSYTWTGAQSATTYFWRVRSIDAAGNRSAYSSTFRFDLN